MAMGVFLMAAALSLAHGGTRESAAGRGRKDYGTIYRRRRRRPDLENHIKPYIYDYLWTSLSQEGRKREAILLTEAKWLL